VKTAHISAQEGPADLNKGSFEIPDFDHGHQLCTFANKWASVSDELHGPVAMTKTPRINSPHRKRAGVSEPTVDAIFDAYPSPVKTRLLALRRLIFDTADTTEGVGPLEETLKWGQPSYLTTESKSGSTIRIDQVKAEAGRYAVYFHCQTDLVETFRELYPELRYGGNRSILLDAGEKLPEKALRHCVALALTYHARKRTRVK
jgi:hypothetical protein